MLSRRHDTTHPAAGLIARGLFCAALGLSLASGQNPLTEDEAAPSGETGEALLEGDLLRDGSILKDVRLPRYDGELNMTSSVHAEELVIVNLHTNVMAKNLVIETYDEDGKTDTKLSTKKARFHPGKNLLTSDDPVTIIGERLAADGAGLVFDTKKSRGFLRGPVKAVSEIDTRTSMNARPARHALAAGALLMASTAALPAQEKEPATAERFAGLRLKPAELEQVTAESASKKELAGEAAKGAEASIAGVKAQSEEARLTMNGFLAAASLAALTAEPAPATGEVPLPEIPVNPQKTTITSKDGAYFDSPGGLAIFLKDVEVKNPQFQLKGADELKIFMNPQEPDGGQAGATGAVGQPKLKPGGKPKAEKVEITPEMAEKMRAAKEAAAKLGKTQESGGDFGDVKRLVATGVIEIFYKPEDPKEEPLLASARTVVYDLEKEQIILRGGSPWILLNGDLSRLTGEDAYFLIHTKNGEPIKFVTGNQEKFETEFSIEEKGADKKDEKKSQNR